MRENVRFFVYKGGIFWGRVRFDYVVGLRGSSFVGEESINFRRERGCLKKRGFGEKGGGEYFYRDRFGF